MFGCFAFEKFDLEFNGLKDYLEQEKVSSSLKKIKDLEMIEEMKEQTRKVGDVIASSLRKKIKKELDLSPGTLSKDRLETFLRFIDSLKSFYIQMDKQ